MKRTLKAAFAAILAAVMALATLPSLAVESAENIFSQSSENRNASTEAATDDCHPNIKNYSDTTLQGMRSRAEAIVNHEWIPSNDIRTWNNNPYNGSMYFYAGSIVRGVPYTLFTTEVVSWSLLSLAQYTQVESSNYHDTAYCVSVGATRTGPVYGSCCADLVSEVFGGSYMSGNSTRYHSVPAIRNAPKSNTLYNQTVSSIRPGDALSDNPGHTHIVWVGDVTDTQITIYEQTPPVARKVVLNKANHTNANGYLVYGGKVYNVITRSTEFVDAPVAPPAAPTNLHTVSGKTMFSCNEYIEFAWDASTGATNYWCYMWKDGVELYGTDMGNSLSFLSAPTSAGNYTFIVRAGNSAGYSDSSAYVYFTVYDSAPAAPTNLHTVSGKTMFSCNEYIEFAWNASETATGYLVSIYKEGYWCYDAILDAVSAFTSQPTEPGNYTIIVKGRNDFGYGDAASLDFSVCPQIDNQLPCNLGSDFYAFIEHQSTGLLLTNQLDNIAGETACGNERQIWHFYRQSNGAYAIISVYDNSCMDVWGSYTDDGTNVYAYNGGYLGNPNQQFWIYSAFGSYYFIPVHTDGNRALDMSLSTHNLEIWVLGADWAPQEFNIIKVATLDNNLPCNIGDDFFAFIEHQTTGLFLTNQLHNIGGEIATGDNRQIWHFYRQSNGAYAIISVYDNSCMDVWGSYTDDGTNVYAYNGGYLGNPNQQFWIYSVFGSYYFMPVHTDGNRALDMSLSTHNLEIWGIGADWAPQKFNIINTTYPIAVTPGDIDGNGTVNVADALLALRMAMNIMPVTNLDVADINGDGIVNVMDALLIMRISIGTA